MGLNFINKIRPVSYFRKDDVAQKTEFDFIVQELEIAFNEASVDSREIISKTANGMYPVRYNDLLPITIKAVHEQQQQIDELKKANAERTKINAEILKRLEKLENN